jgi:pimeloyl-ACP methyl ester carboxylesterase
VIAGHRHRQRDGDHDRADTRSMPPVTGFPRTPPSSRTERTERTEQPARDAAAAPPAPAETPQPDWTKTLTNPQQQADARRRFNDAVPPQVAEAMRERNEQAEMDAIGGKNQPGVLLSQGGDARKGTTVTVHGINDNPASVLPLGEKAAKKGQAVGTFAWDDRSRRLGDSADDFARAVKSVLDKNPSAPLTINAYSMGGRVAAVGLARLEATGALQGRDVRLNLVAPPLQGFSSANMAWMGAAFSSSLRSSMDMGTNSDFQAELEGVRFKDAKVQVFGGAADETAVVDEDWTRIARQLGGGREPVVMPGATHDSSVVEAARRLR